MKRTAVHLSIASFSLALWCTPGQAGELRPETLSAWQAYVQTAENAHAAGCTRNGKFLLVDEVPGRAQSVREGNVAVFPVDGGLHQIAKGLIHDWAGAVFIPNTALEQVMSSVQDYDRYRLIYAPAVVDSRTIRRRSDKDVYSMRLMRRVLVVTAVFDTEHEAHYQRLDDSRRQSIDYTTVVQEVERFGKPDERQLAPDQGNGYLWRLFSVTRYEARDGGVYVEIQAVALTRDVPGYLRWLVNPLISRLPRELLRSTLEQTRTAVLAKSKGTPGTVLPTAYRHLSRQVPILGSVEAEGSSRANTLEANDPLLAADVVGIGTPRSPHSSAECGATELVRVAPARRMLASNSNPLESNPVSPEMSTSNCFSEMTEEAVRQECKTFCASSPASSPASTNRKVVWPS
jgi:hypothetical protein